MTARNREQRLKARYAREDSSARELALAALASSFEGRRFLWNLLAECSTFESAFAENALRTAFTTGKQSIGQAIYGYLLSTHPELIIKMSQENADLVAKRAEELASAREPRSNYDAE